MTCPFPAVVLGSVDTLPRNKLPQGGQELTPELTLVPGNATISKNVTVTLGCQSNVKARLCRWSFIPAQDPESRKDPAPFSPMSKEQKQNGRVSDRDCSLRITRVQESHSGKWICALMPLTNQKKFLVSKGAHLTVLDFKKLAQKEKEEREKRRKELEEREMRWKKGKPNEIVP